LTATGSKLEPGFDRRDTWILEHDVVGGVPEAVDARVLERCLPRQECAEEFGSVPCRPIGEL